MSIPLAVQYLQSIAQQLDGPAISHDPRTRSAAREHMRSLLERVHGTIAAIEATDPMASEQVMIDGDEETIDVVELRIWCHGLESRIMSACYDDPIAARNLAEQVIALDPSRAASHAKLAVLLGETRQHAESLEAIDRAIELAPRVLLYKELRDEIIQYARHAPDPTPDYPWWHLGRYFK